jgi:DHA1 family multidrug resistance protein-like MFS transporter
MAYISDSITHEERGGGMGVIGAAMGVGMVLGPGLGGWLAGHSLSTPFFLAASMSILSLILIWFILPESLPEEHRATEVRKFRGPQLGALWKALFGPLGFLLLLAFLVNFALANFEGIFGLFADKRYGSLVQMALTGPATRKLGEPTVIKLSLIASAAGFLLMVLAPNNVLVPVTVGFFVFSNAMLRPAIFSLTSKKTQSGQGMALGLNNAFQSLGRVIGPLWAGSMFDFHITLPYLSAAVIMMVAFVYSMATMKSDAVAPVSLEARPVPKTVARGLGED